MSTGAVSYEAEMLTREQVVEVVRLAVYAPNATVAITPQSHIGNAWVVHIDGLALLDLPAIDKAATT